MPLQAPRGLPGAPSPRAAVPTPPAAIPARRQAPGRFEPIADESGKRHLDYLADAWASSCAVQDLDVLLAVERELKLSFGLTDADFDRIACQVTVPPAVPAPPLPNVAPRRGGYPIVR